MVSCEFHGKPFGLRQFTGGISSFRRASERCEKRMPQPSTVWLAG